MIEPLCYILNLSFDKGYVPDELNITNVVATFKKGDATLIKNYINISILPVFSKIFERLIYKITKCIVKHYILLNFQLGFKKAYSTHMTLTILIHTVTSEMDKREHIIGLFLDFAKAFDTVNHDILLTRSLWNQRNDATIVSKLFVWKITNSKI